jgi:hypothetical protein
MSSLTNLAGGMKGHMAAYFRQHMFNQRPEIFAREEADTVKYYVMGAVGEEPNQGRGNSWFGATDWPIPAQMTPFFLLPGASMSDAHDCMPPGKMPVL